MLERFFRRKKPRIFLGSLAIAERTDLKRHLEEGIGEAEPLDSALHRALIEIFSLPSATCVDEPLPTDLILDVWIARYQVGLADTDLPFFWRPKVTVSSRLSSLITRRTKATFSVTEKMGWWRFVGRAYSWRVFFWAPPFERADVEYLLHRACVRLLTKLQKRSAS